MMLCEYVCGQQLTPTIEAFAFADAGQPTSSVRHNTKTSLEDDHYGDTQSTCNPSVKVASPPHLDTHSSR